MPDTCNGIDDDCDGITDESLTVDCYPDVDNDGYSRSSSSVALCPDPARAGALYGSCPLGHTARSAATADDCDDTDVAIHPGAAEICDRVDQDCSNGGGVAVDEDGDADGYRPASATCTGGAILPGDCDDRRADTHPGVREAARAFPP